MSSTPRHGRAAAMLVSLAVLGSRLLGVVREQVLAAMFNAGAGMDALLAAFQLPNLFRDLFAEGALSTAFTTVFSRTAEQEGDDAAWELGRLTVSLALLAVGLLCLVGLLAAPALVNLTSYGFHAVPGKFEQTVQLARILFPFLLFLSLAALAMGMLNARFVFGVPALAPMAFNLVSIMAGTALAYGIEPQTDWLHPRFTERALAGVAVGMLLGGLAQLAVQCPTLWRQGFRFGWRFRWRDPRLRAVWRLMWPALIAASTLEVNVLVNGQFASSIDGARSWLSFAFRIMYVPVGLFGVAIATVLLPAVSRHAARNNRTAFGKQTEESLRLSLFLALPAAAGLAALAPELVRLLFEHGAFTPFSTAQTAAALRAYAIGLAGYASLKVLVPCFHALNLPRIPLRVNLTAIGVNLALNALLVLVFDFGHVGVAAATAGVILANVAQLAARLHRETPLGSGRDWGRLAVGAGGGSLLAGAAAWAVARALAPQLGPSLAGQALLLIAASAAGAALYGGVTLVCGLPEPRLALDALRRRRRPAA